MIAFAQLEFPGAHESVRVPRSQTRSSRLGPCRMRRIDEGLATPQPQCSPVRDEGGQRSASAFGRGGLIEATGQLPCIDDEVLVAAQRQPRPFNLNEERWLPSGPIRLEQMLEVVERHAEVAPPVVELRPQVRRRRLAADASFHDEIAGELADPLSSKITMVDANTVESQFESADDVDAQHRVPRP